MRILRAMLAATIAIGCVVVMQTPSVHAADPTPTPAIAPPADPTDVRWDFASRTISWTDNSNDETGFSIIYTIGADNAGHEHETAANVTSFAVPEDVNETDRRVAHIVVNAFNSAGSSAGAVAEWDDATPTRVATPPATAASLDASVDDSGNVTWAAVAGAAGYRVHGTLEAMRVNAVNPFCTPPVDSPLTLPVDIDVTLGADATRYPSSLPPVAAGDRWYVFRSSVQVDALAPDGTVLTSAGSSGIGETGCRVDTISAPSTGSAAPDAAWPLGGSAIAPVAALAGAACVGFGLRMRVR